MILVGISGKLGSGKDTVAKRLVEYHGFEKASLADKLKTICMSYDDSNFCQTVSSLQNICRDLFDSVWNFKLMWKVYKLMKKTQPNGWTKLTYDECYKDKTEFSRFVLQEIGDGMRHIKQFYDPMLARRGLPGYYDYEAVWIDYLVKDLQKKQEEVKDSGQILKFVIPDVRYVNEVKSIRKRGGEVWRVEREEENRKINEGERTDFVSETELDNYRLDQYIDNNSTVDQLYQQVDEIIEEYNDLRNVYGSSRK